MALSRYTVPVHTASRVQIKSNVFILPFVHQLISQSAVQKPSLKPQTASNAGVEARWLGKTPLKGQNLGRNLERNQAIITEHGQDVQMFINDQHGQIIGLGQVARQGNRSGRIP